jgi:hypothetical protein
MALSLTHVGAVPRRYEKLDTIAERADIGQPPVIE